MASSRPQDETTEMENRKRRNKRRVESLERRPEQNPPRSHGLECQKISGHRKGIFLDIPFYRTFRDLATSPVIFPENGLAVVYSRHSWFDGTLWRSPLAQNSAPTKSSRRLVRAAWMRCTAPDARGSTELLRSRCCRRTLQVVSNCANTLNAKREHLQA
jgi:hypothetical protein